MANNAKNKIVSFLTANPKLDKISTSALVRKCDSKDENPNAETFLAFDTNESSSLLDEIKTFKNNIFTEIKKSYKKFIGKNFLVEILVESNLLDNSNTVIKTKAKLQKRFKTEISDTDFLVALKECFQKRENRINHNKTDKLNNLSDKAKAKYTGKEKQELMVFLANQQKEKAKGKNA